MLDRVGQEFLAMSRLPSAAPRPPEPCSEGFLVENYLAHPAGVWISQPTEDGLSSVFLGAETESGSGSTGRTMIDNVEDGEWTKDELRSAR